MSDCNKPSPFAEFKVKVEPSSDDEKKTEATARSLVFNTNLPEDLSDENWQNNELKVWHLTPPGYDGFPGIEILVLGVRGYNERGYSDPLFQKKKKEKNQLMVAYNQANLNIGQIPHIFSLTINGVTLKVDVNGKEYPRKFLVYKIDGVVKKRGTYCTQQEIQAHVESKIIPVLKTSPVFSYEAQYHLANPWYKNITSLSEVMDLKNMYNVLEHGFGIKSTTPVAGPLKLVAQHKSALYSLYAIGSITKADIDFWKLTKTHLDVKDYGQLESPKNAQPLAWASNPNKEVTDVIEEHKDDFATPAKSPSPKATDDTEDVAMEESGTPGATDDGADDNVKNANGKRKASNGSGRNTRTKKTKEN